MRDKEFLRALYSTSENVPKVLQILNFAEDTKLNTLIKFLHFLAKGEIPIKKDNFNAVVAQNKLKVLKKVVEKNAAVQRLLKSDRKVKLQFLKKLKNVYPHLLHCLFNQ